MSYRKGRSHGDSANSLISCGNIGFDRKVPAVVLGAWQLPLRCPLDDLHHERHPDLLGNPEPPLTDLLQMLQRARGIVPAPGSLPTGLWGLPQGRRMKSASQ
jgi:hypothetical protein